MHQIAFAWRTLDLCSILVYVLTILAVLPESTNMQSGATCKYHHPLDKQDEWVVWLDAFGLPIQIISVTCSHSHMVHLFVSRMGNHVNIEFPASSIISGMPQNWLPCCRILSQFILWSYDTSIRAISNWSFTMVFTNNSLHVQWTYARSPSLLIFGSSNHPRIDARAAGWDTFMVSIYSLRLNVKICRSAISFWYFINAYKPKLPVASFIGFILSYWWYICTYDHDAPNS